MQIDYLVDQKRFVPTLTRHMYGHWRSLLDSHWSALILPLEHDRDDGVRVIPRPAQRPQPDRPVTTITVHLHEHLEMNPVLVGCLATGHMEHPKHVPETASIGCHKTPFSPRLARIQHY